LRPGSLLAAVRWRGPQRGVALQRCSVAALKTRL